MKTRWNINSHLYVEEIKLINLQWCMKIIYNGTWKDWWQRCCLIGKKIGERWPYVSCTFRLCILT